MKRTFSFLLCTLILFTPVSPIFAWGGDGHQTVGKIASLRIKPRTAQQIALILKPGETLANISTWADTVKERVGKSDPDPDTNSFLQDLAHNARNREWHYVNLPLNCRSYQTCRGFTLENDVVHMLGVSIRTLQDNPSPDYPLSKRNALKLLVHLVGDIHQPLHVGAGYIDAGADNAAGNIIRNPAEIRRKNLPHDKGGNDLVIDGERQNLHGFWDFGLVTSLMTATDHQTSETLGEFLKQSVRPVNSWNSRGPVSIWPAQWATDSLQQSRKHTYLSVVITGRRTIPVLSGGKPVLNNGQPVMQTVYDVSRAENYETANREIVRQQLAKAGFRLAQVLDAIYAR
ncbi:MAG TPA: S1/P1 nuclease [Pyrinomonadaceae bacterium]|nr:S1/P1 nuclease [Pyrinomonadaceae bacterium]